MDNVLENFVNLIIQDDAIIGCKFDVHQSYIAQKALTSH